MHCSEARPVFPLRSIGANPHPMLPTIMVELEFLTTDWRVEQ